MNSNKARAKYSFGKERIVEIISWLVPAALWWVGNFPGKVTPDSCALCPGLS